MISYRTRKALRGFTITLLILLLAAVVTWMVWIVWLDRFVVYSRDGATLDFTYSSEQLSGEIAIAPETPPTVSIYYNDGQNDVVINTELSQFSGYYIDSAALMEDLAAVREQIERLPDGSVIMLDLKNIRGYFYYSTEIGDETVTSLDIAAMDDLIAYINNRDLYTIARIPAFQDYYYGLNHVPFGLFNPNGLSLWMDDERTYWLNPTSDGTISYLTRIAGELNSLGFDEVVFSQFRFPDTDRILFDGDRTQAINEAAEDIAAICATDRFCVSFVSNDENFVLPEGRCRQYLTEISASNADSFAAGTGIVDPNVRLVFVTELGDTRYDAYSVLRPLSSLLPSTE